MALEIIGAGFGRTATNTLKISLEQLGFDKCYHMYEVFERPHHASEWLKAARGEAVDWETLFEGFKSGVDWPLSFFWRELSETYPEAKIILSLRDPEAWYKSFSSTIAHTLTNEMPDENHPLYQALIMAKEIVVQKTFGGNIHDKDHVIEIYNRNTEEVKAAFGPDRLLVYDAKEGWGSLCAFLDCLIPSEPMGVTNTTEEFQGRAEQRREM